MPKIVTKGELNLQEVYDQTLFNRYYSYKTVNLTYGKKYRLQLIAMTCVLLTKLTISRLFRKPKLARDSMFIVWSPLHRKRAKDLLEKFTIVEFNRLSFSKKQIGLFATISLREFSLLLSTIKKSDVTHLKNSSLYLTDNLHNRIMFVIDFLALRNLMLGADNVLMAGQGDRPSVIISRICRKNDIHLTMLQHGAIGKREKWIHLRTNRFFYLYPFSRAYAKHLIHITEDTELHHLPKKASSLDLKEFKDGKFARNLAYATSPADSEKDVAILEKIKSRLERNKINLLIYPHPLEKESYYEHLAENQSVFVTRERHKNVEHLISRYSTLGLDYYEQGIAPIFLNFENLQIDFLAEKTFLVFHDLEEFLKFWDAYPAKSEFKSLR